MGKILAAIGLLAVGLFVLGAAGFAYLAVRGGKLDREAAAYSTDAVRAITTHWDPAALASRATPQLVASIPPDKLAALFGWFATLGALQDDPDCRGRSSIFASPSGTTTTGKYACAARYQVGQATVTVALVKTGGAWRINGFHVTSPMLLPAKPAQRI